MVAVARASVQEGERVWSKLTPPNSCPFAKTGLASLSRIMAFAMVEHSTLEGGHRRVVAPAKALLGQLDVLRRDLVDVLLEHEVADDVRSVEAQERDHAAGAASVVSHLCHLRVHSRSLAWIFKSRACRLCSALCKASSRGGALRARCRRRVE